MTPQQKIRHAILKLESEWADEELPNITEENIDDIYYGEDEYSDHQEAEEDIRCSGIKTGLPENYSRHYECKEVAAKMPDGSWVGWTYWYGGGKHANPKEIDWISEAYNVDMREEVQTAVVKIFSRGDK